MKQEILKFTSHFVVTMQSCLFQCIASNRAGESQLEYEVEVLCMRISLSRNLNESLRLSPLPTALLTSSPQYRFLGQATPATVANRRISITTTLSYPTQHKHRHRHFHKKRLFFQKEAMPWDPDYSSVSKRKNSWERWYSYNSEHYNYFANHKSRFGKSIT